MRRLPGVEQVGLTLSLPTGEGVGAGGSIEVAGRPAPPAHSEANAALRMVSAHYLRLMRIPLVAGRFFEERDRLGQPNVTIINQAVARRIFPGQNPIGQRLLDGPTDPNMRGGGSAGDDAFADALVVRRERNRSVDIRQRNNPVDQCNARRVLPAGAPCDQS
ncbi:MAG: ABC transporter permease [Blastocatellia bacterium]